MRLYRQLLVAALVVAWSLVGGVGGRSWAAEKGSKSGAGVESTVIPSGVSGGKDSVKGKGSGKDSEKVRSVAAQDGGKVAGGGTVGAGGVAKSSRMSLPLVKGHESKGLKIPYVDTEGRLKMNFFIGVADKLDEDHVKVSDVRVETFGEDGGREMNITIPSGVLNVVTRMITGQEGVVVERRDFQLTGRNFEFNMDTRQGNFDEGVRMLLYKLSDEDKPKSDDTGTGGRGDEGR